MFAQLTFGSFSFAFLPSLIEWWIGRWSQYLFLMNCSLFRFVRWNLRPESRHIDTSSNNGHLEPLASTIFQHIHQPLHPKLPSKRNQPEDRVRNWLQSKLIYRFYDPKEPIKNLSQPFSVLFACSPSSNPLCFCSYMFSIENHLYCFFNSIEKEDQTENINRGWSEA